MTFRLVHRSLAVVAALGLGVGATQAAIVSSTVANVGDMLDGDWTQQVLRDTGPSSVALSASPGGGNGGSFWLHEMTRPQGFGDSSNVVANLFTAASWDPSTQGAVDLIEFALDARGLFSTGIGIPISGFVRPVIEQGGIVYSVAGTSTQLNVGATWQTITRLFSDSDNWIDLAATPGVLPDFSSSGGIIHFGYRYELSLTCPTFNNTAGCTAAQTRLGVDNFRVTVGTDVQAAAVPEPPVTALLAVAMLGLAWAGRRRQH
jgi:MYXO-CTERM domain-containing protein